MNAAMASETARQVIDSQIFFSGKFYFVFTVLMFSAACAGSFVSELLPGAHTHIRLQGAPRLFFASSPR